MSDAANGMERVSARGVGENPVWRWVIYAVMTVFAVFFVFPLNTWSHPP
jgi:hypothetical protein